MRHPRVFRWLGLGLAGVVVALISARPALKAGPPAAVVASASVAGAFGGGGGGGADEARETPPPVYLPARPMSRDAAKTYARLQEKVGMNFPNDTTLEDIKKYVEEVTADKDDPASGVPLYFDPQGLQDSDKTMQSTVTIAFKKPIPLATSLKMILDQVSLKYYIQEDGIIYITSKNAEDSPPDMDHLIVTTLAELRAEVRALREEVGSRRIGASVAGPASMGGGVGGGTPNPGGAGGFR